MRSIPDETTRAAAVKTGEVDLAYLFGGAIAADLQRTPGIRVVAPLLYGVYWLDFLDQWDPKSPWHDRRVRQAASLAIDRNAINQAEMLGLGKAAIAFVPPEFDFALKMEPPAFDPKRAKQLLVEAGFPNGFDAGDLTPLPPYTSLGEAVGSYLQAIGIRTSVRTMERATFMTTWREKKLRGLADRRHRRGGQRGRAGSSPSSPRTASTPTARGRRSTISSSGRRTSWIAASARPSCTRSRRSSRIRCWPRPSSSRPSPGAWAGASRSRRRG